MFLKVKLLTTAGRKKGGAHTQCTCKIDEKVMPRSCTMYIHSSTYSGLHIRQLIISYTATLFIIFFSQDQLVIMQIFEIN